MASQSPTAATDPVVLWLNGGPGCSSLDGFIYEHGPFRLVPNASGDLVLTPFEYTWASLAHMIYLEAPVGVGFSYSDAPDADYACNDDSTATDSLNAIMDFFEKFPELKNRDFFVTGESYGTYLYHTSGKP